MSKEPSGVTQAAEAMRARQHNQPPEPIHDPSAWFEQCTKFGEMAGAGDTSKVGWFIDMAERAWRGEITPEDAEKGYQHYTEARRRKSAALVRRHTKNRKEGKGGDASVRISETKRIITLGALPDIHDKEGGGLGTLHRTLKVIKEDEEIRGEVEVLLLKAARQQCRMPTIPLTEDNIKELLRPKASDDREKTEADYWGPILKRIEKVMKEFKAAKESPDIKTAYNSVQHRIEALTIEGTQKRQVQRQGARGAKK